MIDEMLRNAICRILYRVHPAPLRKDTLASECEIALGRVLTREEFQRELIGLVQTDVVRVGKIGLPLAASVDGVFLTQTGVAECSRVFG